jgi:hypothetical protein
MSYLYEYKLKNVGGNEALEEIDLHRFVGLTLTQRRINNKLVSTYKLIDEDGYLTTLDFDNRQDDAFDFFYERQKANQTR